ncbi:MAG: sauU 4 [Rhodospirillales bacterium]|nr:sauU 4 [Rhodospirillales bacterium]
MRKPLKWKARYTVLSLLSISWIVSFMDRAVMSVAIPYIAADFDLSPLAMGVVMSAFFASYSLSQIPGGLLADKFGIRRVGTLAMLWWSVFTGITGAAANLTQMLIARVAFGLGEGVFPACAFKIIAVWFPKRERATANAIKFASGPLGAALAPLAVVQIVSVWDWRGVFYVLFVPGILISVLFWTLIPNRPSESKRVSPEELAEIEDGVVAATASADEKLGLLDVLKQPNVLKCFSALFFFDIAYWGFTTWLPTYLVNARGFSMTQMGVAASLPHLAGVVGSIFGGWVSDKYFSANRRVPITAAQLLVALLLYLTFASQSAAMLVTCQTLAGFCLAIFFATFWAIPMNTVPAKRMGVTSGVINMAGQVAAAISPLFIGYLVGASGGNFDLTFLLLITCVLVSFAIVCTLPTKLQHHEEEAVHA